jgi:predicted secreted Zn-dependent protease
MLRIYIAQQCFGLSDEGIEDAIYDSQAIRRFVGIDLSHESGFFYNLVRHYSMRKVAALFLGVVVTISAFGDVTETITRQPYEVHQQSGVSLLVALNNASPVHDAGKIYHAYTGWEVRWRFMWNTSPAGMCEITSVATTLAVKMTLPELKTSTLAGSAEFQKYFPALLRHEEGHRKIGQDAAYAADRAISNLRPMSSCKELEREANRAGMEILERARRVEIEYDISTEHGCTQGACLAR